MNKTAKQLSRFSHRAFAGFLALWLSGFIFLFCCEMPRAQAAEGEFCPLKKGQNHCNKPKTDSHSPTVSNQSHNIKLDCCGFLPVVFDKVRKLEKIQQTEQVTSIVKVDLPRFSFVRKDFEVSENYRPPVFNQSKTFIKNCVLRI